MSATADAALHRWLDALWKRHLADLTFAEVRRAVRALSRRYVDRRAELGASVFDGAGKRAAFAMFYAPLHFMTLERIVVALEASRAEPRRILDLGCGTGAASAAWALAAAGRPRLLGVDRSGWAVDEAHWTWRQLGVRGSARRGDLAQRRLPGDGEAVVAAYTVNELAEQTRNALLDGLLGAARGGARVLLVEPIARRPVPWWDGWARKFVEAGGREDTWRFPVELPDPLRELDRAAGLDHRELTARSLFV